MLINIYKNEGLKGYFKGNGANVLRIMPQTSIEFYSYEYLKSKLHHHEDIIDRNIM